MNHDNVDIEVGEIDFRCVIKRLAFVQGYVRTVGGADQCLNGSQHHINSEWEVVAGKATGAVMGMAVVVLPLIARRYKRETRYYRLNGSVRPSDWPRKVGRDQPWLSGLPDQKFRGSKSRNKISANGLAEVYHK